MWVDQSLFGRATAFAATGWGSYGIGEVRIQTAPRWVDQSHVGWRDWSTHIGLPLLSLSSHNIFYNNPPQMFTEGSDLVLESLKLATF